MLNLQLCDPLVKTTSIPATDTFAKPPRCLSPLSLACRDIAVNGLFTSHEWQVSSGLPLLPPHFTTCPFCALPRCKCQYTNSHLKAQLKTQTERKCEQAERQGSRGRVGEGVVKVAAGEVLNECQGAASHTHPKRDKLARGPKTQSLA